MITIPEFVRRYFPNATEDDAFNLLMCCTPYPCGNEADWDRMLKKYAEQTDEPEVAIAMAHEDLDQEWEQLKLEGIV